MIRASTIKIARQYDVAVIGAGFAGLYFAPMVEPLIRENRDEPPSVLINRIVDASIAFAVEQDDDITIVCLKATEPNA